MVSESIAVTGCRLFDLAALASLVLCATAAGLWVRSDRIVDMLEMQAPAALWSIDSYRGKLTVVHYSSTGRPAYGGRWRYVTWHAWDRDPVHPSSWLGVGHGVEQGVVGGWGGVPAYQFRTEYWTLAFPAAVAAASVLPVTWGLRRRARGRLARRDVGRCVACGYDLRATPERCPECGLENETRGGPRRRRPLAVGGLGPRQEHGLSVDRGRVKTVGAIASAQGCGVPIIFLLRVDHLRRDCTEDPALFYVGAARAKLHLMVTGLRRKASTLLGRGRAGIAGTFKQMGGRCDRRN
jgi:hypothetical protein